MGYPCHPRSCTFAFLEPIAQRKTVEPALVNENAVSQILFDNQKESKKK
ncbi:hypothetical protein LYNGBM3L_59630 [Moorena producens 3L]|uniref:Uncharacterized protein n=1 Tax=Moorena producens 3L TaxID=489825 RepID=F4XZV3_9CYAN|nr:hypothetical protein LYNGBM3L_59630 [Moorena producens 3L]